MSNVLHVLNGWARGGIAQSVADLVKSTPNYNHFAAGYCWLDTPTRKEMEELGCQSIVFENDKYPNFKEVLLAYNIDVIIKETGGGDYEEWVDIAHELKIPIIENILCPRKSAIPKDICTFTVAQSNFTASHTKDREVLVMPFPCSLPIGSPKTISETAIAGKKIVIGRLARYEVDKLHHVIFEVAKLLEEFSNSIEFLLMGYEFNEGYYKAIKELEIPGYFTVEGVQEDKVAAINRLDLCINPTWQAGFEYVIVEAMSQGVPVVTWQDSAGPETVEGGGVVTHKSAFGLAVGIFKLLNGPEYEQCSIGAIETVKTKFNPKIFGVAYSELLQRCVEVKNEKLI